MVAKLIERNSQLYCSYCRMRTPLQSHCEFCSAAISNYESLLLKYYNTVSEDEIKDEERILVRD